MMMYSLFLLIAELKLQSFKKCIAPRLP